MANNNNPNENKNENKNKAAASNSTTNSNAKFNANAIANANDNANDNANPRIRRRTPTTAIHPNNHHHNNNPSNDDDAPRHNFLADFQDGKRISAEDNASIIRDVTETFQRVSSKLGFLQLNQRRSPKHKHKHKHKHKRIGGGGGGGGGVGSSAVAPKPSKLDSASSSMNQVRLGVGLYGNFPLAHNALSQSQKRVASLKESGHKQMNHVRATDGWWRTLLVVDERAIDNYLGSWLFISCNALFACLLVKVWGVELPKDALEHWDTVYALVLKTSLAFLLVFRLNRCAMRYWEARGLWGNLTHQTRNLVGALLVYGSHSPKHRDAAIRWGSAFCVAAKNFIRSDGAYPPHELAGFLSAHQVGRLRESSHGPLLAASMCRHYLEKLFRVDETTPCGLAHAHSIRLNECQSYVAGLVEQVSGMEKIRSTPLPIAYVAHLRTFLMSYCLFLPYVWVHEWSWATIPLTAFTAFALLGIEGASSEVEIPFSKARSNHLALEAYCLVILESVTELVVNDANLHMQGRKKGKKDCGDLWRLGQEGFGDHDGFSDFSDSDDDDDDNNDDDDDNNHNHKDKDDDEEDTKGTEETERCNPTIDPGRQITNVRVHEEQKVNHDTVRRGGRKGDSMV